MRCTVAWSYIVWVATNWQRALQMSGLQYLSARYYLVSTICKRTLPDRQTDRQTDTHTHTHTRPNMRVRVCVQCWEQDTETSLALPGAACVQN